MDEFTRGALLVLGLVFCTIGAMVAVVGALLLNGTPRNDATWHEHERSKRFFDGR